MTTNINHQVELDNRPKLSGIQLLSFAIGVVIVTGMFFGRIRAISAGRGLLHSQNCNLRLISECIFNKIALIYFP